MENPDCRILIENIAIAHHAIAELLMEIYPVGSQKMDFVHNMCWQANRDIKGSLFLAMSGRYSGASVIQRGVLEKVAYAIDMLDDLDEDLEKGWQRVIEWLNGEKTASPSGEEIADILSSCSPHISKIIHTSFEENREFRNERVHTIKGDQILNVLLKDENKRKPWLVNINESKLVGWYVGSVTDLFIFLTVILDIFEVESVPNSTKYIADLYHEIQNKECNGIISDHSLSVDPENWD